MKDDERNIRWCESSPTWIGSEGDRTPVDRAMRDVGFLCIEGTTFFELVRQRLSGFCLLQLPLNPVAPQRDRHLAKCQTGDHRQPHKVTLAFAAGAVVLYLVYAIVMLLYWHGNAEEADGGS